MSKLLLLSLLCLINVTACNLTYRSPIQPAAQTISGDVEDFSASPDLTILVAIPIEMPAAEIALSCSPRSDWPVYNVIVGDTLSSIALRSNSSVDELASANCLDNPRLIIVRQKIHVPQLPR